MTQQQCHERLGMIYYDKTPYYLKFTSVLQGMNLNSGISVRMRVC